MGELAIALRVRRATSIAIAIKGRRNAKINDNFTWSNSEKSNIVIENLTI